MEVTNEIETKVATLNYEGDILILRWKKDADVDLDSCIEIIEIRKSIEREKKMLLLIDQRQFWNISKEAKDYSKREEVESLNKAIALLTGDWALSILIANSYIKLYKPNIPVKVFKSKDKAIKWLNSFK